MEELTNPNLRRLQGRLGFIVHQLVSVNFSQIGRPPKWQPAMNAYLCEGEITLCIELAGVEKEAIDLHAEARRLHVSGRRAPAEPCMEKRPRQILALEMDHGEFEREIDLPMDVDVQRVTAEQRNGLLWVHLPLRGEG